MHPLPLSRLLRLLVLLSLSCRLHAGITWERTEAEVTPAEGETRIEVPFAFKVAEGGQAVQILDFGSSCGCTVPELEKRLYNPGESGVLKVVFTSTGKQGKQTNRITLRIQEAGKETRATLLLTAHLPEWAKPEAQRLEWSGGETEAKRLKITVRPGIKLVMRSVPSIAAERFSTSLKEGESSGYYNLEASLVENKPKGLTPVFVDVFRGDVRVGTFAIILLAR